MKNIIPFVLFLSITTIAFTACKKKGCTDPTATNYNENAEKEDGSCVYPAPEGTTVQHIIYGADPRQNFDLFLPSGHDENTKTVVLVHGGGWVMGPLADSAVILFGEAGIDITDRLLNSGYAVAIMKYRLACYTEDVALVAHPPFDYMQTIIEDIDLTIEKLKTDAATLQISATNFALLGESAGGHIALMYALRSDDPTLKTVISFYGPTLLDEEVFKHKSGTTFSHFPLNTTFSLSDRAMACEMRTSGTMNILWGLSSFVGTELETGTTNPSFTDTLSPAYSNNITRNLPVFLLHGKGDSLVPSGHADSLMAQLNLKFGTTPTPTGDFTGQHKLKKYNNCGHGWANLGGSCNKGEIRNDVMSWLAEHF